MNKKIVISALLLLGIAYNQYAADAGQPIPTINRTCFGLAPKTSPILYCQRLQEFLHALLLQDALNCATEMQTNVDHKVYEVRKAKQSACIHHLKQAYEKALDDETRETIASHLLDIKQNAGISTLQDNGRSVAKYSWSYFPSTPAAVATVLMNKELLICDAISKEHMPLITQLMQSHNEEIKFFGQTLNFSLQEQENDRSCNITTTQRFNIFHTIKGLLNRFEKCECAQQLSIAEQLLSSHESLVKQVIMRTAQSRMGELDIHEVEEQAITQNNEKLTREYQHNRKAIAALYAAIRRELAMQCRSQKNRQIYQTLKVPGTTINFPETLQFKRITDDGQLVFDEPSRMPAQAKSGVASSDSWLPASLLQQSKKSPKPARRKAPHSRPQRKINPENAQPPIKDEKPMPRVATPPSDSEESSETIEDATLQSLSWITPYDHDGEIVEEHSTHVIINDPANMLRISLYSNNAPEHYQGAVRYKSNVREWFTDARKALVRQGYLDPHNKNHAQSQQEIVHAVQMHRFSKLVDRFVQTKGWKYKTRSRINPHQADMCIVIPGQIEFLNTRTHAGATFKQHCLFVYIIDSATGYCYHRNMIPCSLVDLLDKWFATGMLIAEFPPL